MSEPNDMTHAELADVAAELALGVITGRERAAAVAHLEWCEACREDVRQLMATGDQLLGLLPPAEPPAGFETRVLERLGLPVPLPGQAEPLPSGRHRHRRLLRRGPRPAPRGGAGTGPGGARPAGTAPGGGPAGNAGSSGPGLPAGTRPGGNRVRRSLAAVTMVLALVAAGFGGWRIGAGPAPALSASQHIPLVRATLQSATHRDVGEVFLYSGKERWLYMTVNLGGGSESVTCQVISTNGAVTTIGSFGLSGGFGGWGSPDPGNSGAVAGARLVAADGTVLATAAFRW